MNQTANANYVIGKLNGMDGLVSAELAERDSEPASPMEYPIAFVYVGEPVDEDLSFGTGGVMASAYDIEITVLLGSPSMLSGDAEALKLLLADRFRATFWQDRTLGGNCLDSKLVGGQNNIDLFRDQDDYPMFTRKVLVLEHTVKSAAQSG